MDPGTLTPPRPPAKAEIFTSTFSERAALYGQFFCLSSSKINVF